MRLTPEEWLLLVNALQAYQHNETYRPLYEKFEAQGAGVMAENACAKGSSKRHLSHWTPDRALN
ncbi:hypothetical protein [Paracoccus jeotgali]|uniref:hypothetical protein n=1 Tax=Paracoccus jeotgali TaxID=2065379 RepID=UPI0028ABA219|nr:hypothetical protein [Paracoccus jeotgali]